MNKNLGIFIGVVVIILIVVFVFKGNSGGDKAMVKDGSQETESMMKDESTDMMQKDETSMMEEDNMMKAGTYEAYAPEKLAKAETGDVVLFFRASWCPTCRAVDADIRANFSSIPADLVILDVDYDNSAALKQKYGVTYQHTFVQVDKNGTLLKKWSGSPTLTKLVSEVI